MVSARSWSAVGFGECSAHVADAAAKGLLLSPMTGCGTGDAACLDRDLRWRDAPAPAAPRWRKTHRGRCSAPLAIRDFVARGGGAELCGSGTWQWHFVQNRFSMAAARRAWRGGARAEASDRRAATAGDVCVIGLALLRSFPRRRRSLRLLVSYTASSTFCGPALAFAAGRPVGVTKRFQQRSTSPTRRAASLCLSPFARFPNCPMS